MLSPSNDMLGNKRDTLNHPLISDHSPYMKQEELCLKEMCT